MITWPPGFHELRPEAVDLSGPSRRLTSFDRLTDPPSPTHEDRPDPCKPPIKLRTSTTREGGRWGRAVRDAKLTHEGWRSPQ